MLNSAHAVTAGGAGYALETFSLVEDALAPGEGRAMAGRAVRDGVSMADVAFDIDGDRLVG